MEIIHTEKAPAAVGPYSQAVTTGNYVFLSGQIGINPVVAKIDGKNVTEQTEQICKNISEVLSKAGSSFDKVIKTTCFLTDIATFAEFNAVYAKYFVSKPARSCVAVTALPAGALCEIEVIAEK